MKHRHKFRRWGSSSKAKYLRCECGESKEVALSKRERAAWWKQWKATNKKIAKTHEGTRRSFAPRASRAASATNG